MAFILLNFCVVAISGFVCLYLVLEGGIALRVEDLLISYLELFQEECCSTAACLELLILGDIKHCIKQEFFVYLI